MEVSVTVERLRMSLSTEQSEDFNTPKPSTPKSKRGGKLVAKPKLDLIEENDLDMDSAKTTKKTTVKDLIDTTEERLLTPTRRSARIKSNTSIVSETTKSYESPRAKRAARRLSQTGVDNEAPITPIKATRRTRKDSSTSVDKLGVDNEAPITPIKATRRTRKDSSTSVDKLGMDNEQPITPLKSTRRTRKDSLTNVDKQGIDTATPVKSVPPAKVTRRSRKNSASSLENLETVLASAVSSITEIIIEEVDDNSNSNDTTSNMKDSTPITKSLETYYNKRKLSQSNKEDKIVNDTMDVFNKENTPEKNSKTRLSDTNLNLLKELDTKTIKRSSAFNKSTSDLDVTKSSNNVRKRAKSFTADSQKSEITFYSDNERTKLMPFDKKYIKRNINKIVASTTNLSQSETSHSNNLTEEKSQTAKKKSPGLCDSHNLLKGNMSETNFTQNKNKFNDSLHLGSEKPIDMDLGDQCVPVVENGDSCKMSNNDFNGDSEIVKRHEVDLQNFSDLKNMNKNFSKDDTFEPMDVDETLPDEILIDNHSQNANNSKRGISSLLQINYLNESSNDPAEENIKVTENDSQNLKLSFENTTKVENENKSTLIISEIKDNALHSEKNKTNNKLNKSKRNSSISCTEKHEIIDNDIETINTSLKGNKSANEMTETETPENKNTFSSHHDNSQSGLNDPKHKKSISEYESQSKVENKNKSTLLISEIKDNALHSEKNKTKIKLNKSKRNSSISSTENHEIIDNDSGTINTSLKGNKSANEMTETETPKNKNTFSSHLDNSQNGLNNPKHKKSISEYESQSKVENENKSTLIISEIKDNALHSEKNKNNNKLNKSKRNSSISSTEKHEIIDNDSETINTSLKGNKSANEMTETETPKNKNTFSSHLDNSQNGLNDPKHKKSISEYESQSKVENENKSTLIISEIKDMSNGENSVTDSPCTENKSKDSESHNKSETENKDTLKISEIKDKSKADSCVTESPYTERQSVSMNCMNAKMSNQDKKKLSLDYSTSTPLQQKKPQRLAMQINTSVINTTDQRLSLKKMDTKNCNGSLTSDSSSSPEDEISKTCSNLFNLEADVADNDYESGNSRDEEDIQYEKENEIVEKGETLDTTEDISNDSDYEKDSFVVGSNEEDNELLSGSGEDLSMGENELTMSKNSKEKYNSKKAKEQKRASREMFESRHKLETSKRKQSSSKLDSSIDSEPEIIAPVQRYRHRRLDSTQDDISDSVKSDPKSNKKRKRLSDSDCSNTANNELEITIANNGLTEIDPLSTQVKLEPQTPNIKLNISTVEINQNIEEIKVTNNMSIMNSDPKEDPLLYTFEEDSLSDMENSKIITNYNSVLENLNSSKESVNVKTQDMSLNLETKKKKHAQEPIVDQLNLTNTTICKKKEKLRQMTNSVNDNSSDSVDLTLLFSEDSSDVDQDRKKSQSLDSFIPLKRTPGKTNILNNKAEENKDSNKLQLSMTDTQSIKEENSYINKRNKNKSLDISEILITKAKEDTESNNIELSITDTKIIEDVTTSINKKKKKNKNKSLENNETIITEDVETADYNILPFVIDTKGHQSMNTSFTSPRNKKRNNSLIENTERDELLFIEDTKCDQHENTSISFSLKKKKKNKYSDNNLNFVNTDDMNQNTVVNKKSDDVISGSSKKKRKNKSLQNSGLIEGTDNSNLHFTEATICHQNENTSISFSSKKKNSNSESNSNFENIDDMNQNTADNKNTQDATSSSSKKNKSFENSCIIESTNENNVHYTVDTVCDENTSTNFSSKKKKKNNNSGNNSNCENTDDKNHNTVDNKNTQDAISGSPKKKKKNKSLDNSWHIESTDINVKDTDDRNYNYADIKNTQDSFSGSSKKNKKNKSFDNNLHIESTDNDNLHVENTGDENTSLNVSLKKKKNKSHENSSHKLSQDAVNTSVNKSEQNKKTHSASLVDNIEIAELDETTKVSRNTSKKHDKKKSEFNVVTEEHQNTDSVISPTKKKSKKKRNHSDSRDEATDETSVSWEADNSKKRKRKYSPQTERTEFEQTDGQSTEVTLPDSRQTKKIKISEKQVLQNEEPNIMLSKIKDETNTKYKHKKKKDSNTINKIVKEQNSNEIVNEKKKTKKRKERDEDDDVNNVSKVKKENSFDKVHVSRLPESVLSKLEDKPKNDTQTKKLKNMAISTTPFTVDETKKRKNKPSTFLEESIYLNDINKVKKEKGKMKKPKVLPFIPTATTSGSGFTSKIKIDVIPEKVEFVGQGSNVANFKNDYLFGNKIKRLGTYEMYKKHRCTKMSKF